MSKPLELHWYPCEWDRQLRRVSFFHPGSFPLPDLYTHPRQYLAAILRGSASWEEHMEAKRLTDAETAAEWWKSLATVPALGEIGEYRQGVRESQIAKTLERFATLPHASEAGYE